jgi:hypothetical protein
LSKTVVQRLLAIPLILLLLILAIVVAVHDTSPPPPGAAPPMPPVVLIPQEVAGAPSQPDSNPGWREFFQREYSRSRMPIDEIGDSFISGVVLDRDTGSPIADAFVTAWRVTGRRSAPPMQSQSGSISMAVLGGARVDADRHGAFRLGPLPPGRYVLEAYHDGGGLLPWNSDDTEQIHELGVGEELEGARLHVYEGHTVRIKMVDSSTQMPLSGINVLVGISNVTETLARATTSGIQMRMKSSNPEGVVVADGVFGDVVTARFKSPHYYLADEVGRRESDYPIRLDRTSTTMEITVPLTPVPLIEGRILKPDGTPATEAHAMWQQGNPRSYRPFHSSNRANPLAPVNEKGGFRFLPPGAQDGFLVVSVPGYPLALSPEIRFDQVVIESFDVRLEEPATVKATVTYPDGSAAKRALVTLTPSGSYSPGFITYVHDFPDQSSRWMLKELCDESGVAMLTGLSPGQYNLTAETEGYAPSRVGTVRVEAGATEGIALGLGVYGVLGGTVRSPDGEPLEGAIVRLFGPRMGSHLAQVRTDATGGFSFDRVSSTIQHRISVTHSDYLGTDLNNPELNRLDLELTLSARQWRYTHVLNVVDEETGEPIAGASLVGVEESDRIRPRTTGNSISFEWQNQAAGMIVRLAAPGYATTIHSIRPMKEDPGGRFEETVKMGRGVTIIGRVLDEETGAVMSGVPVRVFASTTPPAGSLWGVQGHPIEEHGHG